MPCNHASNRRHRPEREDSAHDGENGIDRREFVKSALAIGGSSALAATAGITGFTGTASAGHGVDFVERENRQHAWADYLATDQRGLTAPPRYHVLLYMDYQGSGEPTPEDRTEMEAALRQLEAAFDWSNEGLLFTVNYSLSYFDRFDEDLPAGVDLRTPEAIIDAVSMPDEDPTPEPYEVLIDLASDTVSNLLAAEEALWGERDELDGVSIDATLEGIFERPTEYPDRRTGFVGSGAPAEEFDNDDIDEEAPLSMGFQSVFEDNIPDEDDVTMVHDQRLGVDSPMPPGVFAQGSVQHSSNLTIDLDTWYEQSHEERANRMFSPNHTSEEVGPVGNALGQRADTSDMPMRDADADVDIARRTQQDAEEQGVVGHEQKLARARFDLGRRSTNPEPDGTDDTTILRRDFNTADVGESGLHFLALMRFNGYMVYVRQAMNGVGFDADEAIPNTSSDVAITHDDVDIPLENDGFLAFVEALRRGNFVVPPLTLRSLPPADAVQAEVTVGAGGDGTDSGTVDASQDTVTVEVTDDGGANLEPQTIQNGGGFGDGGFDGGDGGDGGFDGGDGGFDGGDGGFDGGDGGDGGDGSGDGGDGGGDGGFDGGDGGFDGSSLQHVRFGRIETVNKADGASPTAIDQQNGTLELEFPVDDLGFQSGSQPAKLLVIDGGGTPIEATTTVTVEQDGMVINDYDGDPPWPYYNDVGGWIGAGGFENGGGWGQGEVADGTLVLEYDDSGWYTENVEEDLADYTELVFRIRGENGGEGEHFLVDVGDTRTTFAEAADGTIGTTFSEVSLDISDVGGDGSGGWGGGWWSNDSESVRLNFWQGSSGSGTIEIEEIVAR